MKYRIVIENCQKGARQPTSEQFEKHIIEAPSAADALTIAGIKLKFPWSDPNNNEYHAWWRELRDIEWVPDVTTDWKVLTEEDKNNAGLIVFAVNTFSDRQASFNFPNATPRPWSITLNESRQITIAGPDTTDRNICHIQFPEPRK